MKEILRKTHRKNSFFLLVFVLLFFLGVNIYYSQNVSPIFFGLVSNNKKSAIEFLQKIRNYPDFDQQLRYYEDIYGSFFKNEVFAQELQREAMINQLEQILEKNHQSRDVLYRLYQLYLAKNDKLMAEKYLRLAKEVDPTIK